MANTSDFSRGGDKAGDASGRTTTAASKPQNGDRPNEGKGDDAAQDAQRTAEHQRTLQQEQDARDHRRDAASKSQPGSGKDEPEAPQTGARPHPESPMPAQHLDKPGIESKLDPAPQFLAPDYVGSGKLEGMTALITGGDSGIGRAVAVLFAREGADVAIVYLSEDSDAETTRQCVQDEGQRCLLIAGDVKDKAFCEQAVKQTVNEFGKLDILVNNAGFQEHSSSLLEVDTRRLDETIHTNIYGYIYMAQAALPHLKEGSCIINTGSVTGLKGNAHLLEYSTTKGAIHAFTKALAGNLAPKGIRVNAVAPGPVWTPLNPADGSAEKIRKFGADTAMKRPAQPEELSPAYVFLAAPVMSSYITGIVLPVTGSPG